MTAEEVRAAQQRLWEMGYAPGPRDGIAGPQTWQAAWRAFLDTMETPDTSNDAELIAELRRDEGTILHAYQDHLGYWTIGTGRLIDKRRGGGISPAENDYLLRNDVARVQRELDAVIPWWRSLDPVRQRAVINMGFQMGTDDLTGVTFSMIRFGKYAEAAARLRKWKWASQTPERAARIIHMIEFGRT